MGRQSGADRRPRPPLSQWVAPPLEEGGADDPRGCEGAWGGRAAPRPLAGAGRRGAERAFSAALSRSDSGRGQPPTSPSKRHSGEECHRVAETPSWVSGCTAPAPALEPQAAPAGARGAGRVPVPGARAALSALGAVASSPLHGLSQL